MEALFLFFQSTIPIQNRFDLLLMYSRCIDGKREVKAVTLLGNIKDLNDKI